MRKQTKRKLIEFLYEISPKEDRDSLVLKQTGNITKDIENISKAIIELDERYNGSQERLVDAINSSISALRGEIEEKMGEDKDSILQEHHTKIMELYGTYESSISSKSETLSKSLKSELLKEIKIMHEEIERVRGLAPKAWGGSSRMIYNNGQPMSPENLYSDINLIMGSGLTLTAVNNTQTLRVDVTISVTGGGGSANIIFGEVVAGSSNTFTLAHTPSGTISLSANGQVLTLTTDYTISGAVITTISSWSTGSVLASYKY